MTGSTSGGLRDLLSSVAQQVESHLYPPSSSTSTSTSTSTLSSLSPPGSRVGRRRSRIRSWIIHDKDKDKEDASRSDGGDNSLHFTDSSDDDFHDAVSGVATSKPKKERRSEVHGTLSASGDAQAQTPPPQGHAHAHTRTQSATRTRTRTPTHAREEARPEARMQLTPDELREEETVDMLTGLMGDDFDREVVRRILRKYGGDVDKAAGALVEGERGEELVGQPLSSVGPGPAQGQQQSHNHNPNQIQIQTQGWPVPGAGTGGVGASSTGTGTGTSGGVGASGSGWPTGSSQTRTHTPISQSQSGLRLDAPSALGGRPNTPVIDLTLDDDPDLQRAMEESMSTLHAEQSQMQVYAPVYAPAQAQVQGEGQEGPVFGPSNRPADPSWALVPSHVRCSFLPLGGFGAGVADSDRA